MFCRKCGAEVAEGEQFCAKCGSPVEAAGNTNTNNNTGAAGAGYSSTNAPIMNARATSIVGYMTFIGWAVAFLLGDHEKAKFYLNQALLVNIVGVPALILSIVICVLPWYVVGLKIVLGFLYWTCFFPAWVILFVFGVIWAAKQNPRELPLIGHIRLLH